MDFVCPEWFLSGLLCISLIVPWNFRKYIVLGLNCYGFAPLLGGASMLKVLTRTLVFSLSS